MKMWVYDVGQTLYDRLKSRRKFEIVSISSYVVVFSTIFVAFHRHRLHHPKFQSTQHDVKQLSV